MKLDLRGTPELHLAAIDILARERLSIRAIGIKLIGYGFRTNLPPRRLLRAIRAELLSRPFTFIYSPLDGRWSLSDSIRRMALT